MGAPDPVPFFITRSGWWQFYWKQTDKLLQPLSSATISAWNTQEGSEKQMFLFPLEMAAFLKLIKSSLHSDLDGVMLICIKSIVNLEFLPVSSCDVLHEPSVCSAVSQSNSAHISAMLTLHFHMFIILPIVSTCLRGRMCAVFEILVGG